MTINEEETTQQQQTTEEPEEIVHYNDPSVLFSDILENVDKLRTKFVNAKNAADILKVHEDADLDLMLISIQLDYFKYLMQKGY